MNTEDVTVIGCGIVGLAVAHHLVEAGRLVTMVDRDPAGDKASFGNAGGIAVPEVIPAAAPGVVWRVPGWLFDPLGPLAVRPRHAVKLIPWLIHFCRAANTAEMRRIARALASLNLRTYDDLLPMLRSNGLQNEINQLGALTIYQSEAGYQRDHSNWLLRRELGIEWQEVDAGQLRELEPDLGPNVRRAILTPQWSHVNDPKDLLHRLRSSLQMRGVTFHTGEVDHIVGSVPNAVIHLTNGKAMQSSWVVVAAGAWSGKLAQTLGDRVLLESERGYNTTIARPNLSLRREIIFAERNFVATPLSCGLRIGGAAEFGGLEAKPDFRRSETLAKLASLYLPGLDAEAGVHWAGHRPTTPDSLPVIDRSRQAPNVLYAFGHGHLGLTQAATTGSLVRELILDRRPSIDLSPFAVRRFA